MCISVSITFRRAYPSSPPRLPRSPASVGRVAGATRRGTLGKHGDKGWETIPSWQTMPSPWPREQLAYIYIYIYLYIDLTIGLTLTVDLTINLFIDPTIDLAIDVTIDLAIDLTTGQP